MQGLIAGLLEVTGGSDEATTISAWAQILALTEDEDPGVRQAAAKSLGSALASLGSQDCSAAAISHVQRQAFSALTARFGASNAYLTLLLDLIHK